MFRMCIRSGSPHNVVHFLVCTAGAYDYDTGYVAEDWLTIAQLHLETVTGALNPYW